MLRSTIAQISFRSGERSARNSGGMTSGQGFKWWTVSRERFGYLRRDRVKLLSRIFALGSAHAMHRNSVLRYDRRQLPIDKCAESFRQKCPISDTFV